MKKITIKQDLNDVYKSILIKKGLYNTNQKNILSTIQKEKKEEIINDK